MIWRAFEVAAPHLAELGRKRLEQPGLALLGTIRRDGSPRISPIELHIVAGHLLFGVMRSGKRHDLARDPRCTLHSAVTDPNGGDGEFKVHGRATPVVDRALRDASDSAWWRAFPVDAAEVYSMDIESAAMVRWDARRGQLSIEDGPPRAASARCDVRTRNSGGGGVMSRPRVFVARLIPDDGLRPVLEACDARVWEGELPPPRDVLLRAVEGCDGILTLLTDRVDDELLDRAGPGLKVVSNFAVGFDNIDVPACTRRGIPVGNTPGVLTDTTADLAWALLMAAARRVAEGDRYVRAGRWRTWGPMLLMGPDVHGGTLGIVGFGRIGQAVARRAMGFGMTILYYDTRRADAAVETGFGATFVSLEELLARSDFVSLHVNLTEETRHLVNPERLRSMKPTAILVNTSRGPVVDQRALFEALRDGVIGAAALDVTDPEPIATDDPLLTLDNCLVVPHIASASRATRGKMAAMAAANLLAGVRGERLPTPVNPEVYD